MSTTSKCYNSYDDDGDGVSYCIDCDHDHHFHNKENLCSECQALDLEEEEG